MKDVSYTSPAGALDEFRTRHQNDVLTIQALEELGENPLGGSLAIRAENPGEYESIATFLESKKLEQPIETPFIDRINFFQNEVAIERLSSIISTVDQGVAILMAIFVVASVLITFNTIRLAIYTMREEISVMRLVGASNTFIRGPFVLQGLLYGVAAGIVALLILYPATLYIGNATEGFFQFNIFSYFVADFPRILGVMLGVGVLLGVLSSAMAVARYLRV